MSKFFKLIVQFKFLWGLIFTATILLYSVVSMFLGDSSMEFVLIWEFVLITMILTFIHYLTFGEFLFIKLSSKHKLVIHFLLCYITLFISAFLLEWISISKASSLGIFTLGYIFLYLAISFSLHVYYKITGEQLNNKLAIYKQKKNIN